MLLKCVETIFGDLEDVKFRHLNATIGWIWPKRIPICIDIGKIFKSFASYFACYVQGGPPGPGAAQDSRLRV